MGRADVEEVMERKKEVIEYLAGMLKVHVPPYRLVSNNVFVQARRHAREWMGPFIRWCAERHM